MLRRYTPFGLETLNLSAKVTTIGSSNCDLTIESDSLEPQHAVIEYNPVSRSFWMKDLGTSSGTIVNGQPLYGTMELKQGDQIKFGYGPEYIFEVAAQPLRDASASRRTLPPTASRLPSMNE
uniref:FHA domain-containing protein n=1 Tax=Plectus sambesii TaxID=2011161 RepID=A0A914X5D3_9BILA